MRSTLLWPYDTTTLDWSLVGASRNLIEQTQLKNEQGRKKIK